MLITVTSPDSPGLCHEDSGFHYVYLPAKSVLLVSRTGGGVDSEIEAHLDALTSVMACFSLGEGYRLSIFA